MKARVLHVIHTTLCPFSPKHCRYCYMYYNLSRGVIRPGRLDPRVLEDYVAKLDPEWIAVGGGEPLYDFTHTMKIVEVAKRYGVRVEVTTSGYDLERLERLVGVVDHVQVSIGDNRYQNPKALELLSKTGKSYGVNILLSERIVSNLVQYIERLIVKYKPGQVIPIVPRIYRLPPDAFRRYVAKIPVLLALGLRHGITVAFDCITALTVFDHVAEDEATILPDGRLALCSTHPHVKSHRSCPDATHYKKYVSRLQLYFRRTRSV